MWRNRVPPLFIKVAIWVSVLSVLSFTYQLIYTNSSSSSSSSVTSGANHHIHMANPFHRILRNAAQDNGVVSDGGGAIQNPTIYPGDTIQIQQLQEIATTLPPSVRHKIDMLYHRLNTSTHESKSLVYPGRSAEKFLSVNAEICKDAAVVDVVIIVHTAPAHVSDRQRMRDSFAKRELFYPFQVRIAFLLGRSKSPKIESSLVLEQSINGDLVIGDFIDDYHNLTIKGVMGYHWVSKYCSNAKYVLKIDDDVLINTYKLLHTYLSHIHGKEKSIFCNVWSNNTMPILRKGRWKVPDHLFHKMDTFPYSYCSGFLVMITGDLMGPMYQASRNAPFFWIDDLYLFGILPSIVGGVTYYNYPLDKNTSLNDKVVINCTRDLGVNCPIFGTIISQNAYWSLWATIKKLFGYKPWNAPSHFVP